NPCTTCSLLEAQMVPGKGTTPSEMRYPLNDGTPPSWRIMASARSSSSAVLTPGRTASRSMATTSARRRPLWRISASSQGSFTHAMSEPGPLTAELLASAAHATARRGDAVVVLGGELRLDLGDGVEGDAHDDEQA